MKRVYNFSAGPSMLPQSVLEKAAAEMLDYQGSGQSVMEMSHRSKIYAGIIEGAEALLREVIGNLAHLVDRFLLNNISFRRILHLRQRRIDAGRTYN